MSKVVQQRCCAHCGRTFVPSYREIFCGRMCRSESRSEKLKARWANTPARRAKMSEWSKARWANDPAHRTKKSEKLKALWADPAYRAKMSEKLKARWANDPAYRAKMSEKLRARMSDPAARTNSSETRRKTNFRKWSDPAYRERMSEKARVRFSDPAMRKNLSEKARARMSDPAYRERVFAYMRDPIRAELWKYHLAEAWRKPEVRERYIKSKIKFTDRADLGRALCRRYGIEPGKDKMELAMIADIYLKKTRKDIYDLDDK